MVDHVILLLFGKSDHSFIFVLTVLNMGFPAGTVVKNPPANAEDAGDVGSIPGSGRSPGVGNGNPLQYSCLKIPWTEEPDGLQSKGLQRVRCN